MIKLIIIMAMSVFFQLNSYSLPLNESLSKNYFEKKRIGEIEESKSQIVVDGKTYGLYNLQDTLYVPMRYLEGLDICIETVEEGVRVLLIDEVIASNKQNKCQEIMFKDKGVYINNFPVYIGNLKTYSLLVEDEILIPLDALSILWDLSEYMNQYSLKDKYHDLNRHIKIEDEKIINQSPYLLRIGYRDIFWDGKDYKEIDYESVLLESGQVLDRKLETKEKMIHITTVLTDIYGLPQEMNEQNPYGQKNTSLFMAYEKVIRLEALDKIFVPYIVTGTIKYPVGKFKEKDKVVVWRGEKRQYYVVMDTNNKKVSIPWGSIDIIGDLGGRRAQATKQEIEDYVNLKGMLSDTEYFVWTDLYRQRTYILKQQEGQWKVEKMMICSTGKNTYLTPRGEYKLEYRIPYFGMGKGFMCKNAVVIFRDYMYHSILFDKTGKYVKEGKYQLGQRVSHGCVRLSEEDSEWIYKHIPLGTTVWIN